MIHEKLKHLGFGDKEIDVYLKILERGKTTPTQVANETKINRTTVYAIVKNLVEKELITEDLGGKNLFLVALPINNLSASIRKEENELDKKKKIINDAILELEQMSFTNKSYSVPKIRFVDERDVEKYLYKNLEKWVESSKKLDNKCWGFQDHDLAEKFNQWIEWAAQTYPNITTNLLSNTSVIENKMKKKKINHRVIKVWKKDIDFSASTWIMGDFLIMLITRQRPNYLVEIHDKVIAHNMREVYKNIWMDIKS